MWSPFPSLVLPILVVVLLLIIRVTTRKSIYSRDARPPRVVVRVLSYSFLGTLFGWSVGIVLDCAGVPTPMDNVERLLVFLPLLLIQSQFGPITWAPIVAHIGFSLVVIHQLVYFWNSRRTDDE